MKTLGHWLGMALGLWAVGVLAQGEPVLTVLEKSYAAAELGLQPNATECREVEPLIKGVIGPLFADYCRTAGISVSADELKDYCRRQLPDEGLFTETWAAWAPNGVQWKARQEASAQMMVWKLQKSLFAKYGGRVIRSDWTSPQAFDAMFAYVAEREKAGDFEILDARLKLRFWECLRTPKDPLVPAEEGRTLIEEHPVDRRKRLAQANP
jgi:hypothetical protein